MQLEIIVLVTAFAWMTIRLYSDDAQALSMERKTKRLLNLYLRTVTGKQKPLNLPFNINNLLF